MAAQLIEQETTFPGNSLFTPPNGGAVNRAGNNVSWKLLFLRRRMAAQLIEQETTFPGNSFLWKNALKMGFLGFFHINYQSN
jgi:hypothetical protein